MKKKKTRGNPNPTCKTPPVAPKGNKYALGNNGGAPRTVSLDPDQMILLGQDMLDFVSDPNNDVLNLSEWYSGKMMIPYSTFKAMVVLREFLPYYEKAKSIVGKKFLTKDSSIRTAVSPTWQLRYFPDLKEEEQEKYAVQIREELKAKQEMNLGLQIPPQQFQLDLDDEKIRMSNEIAKLKEENAALKEQSINAN